MTNNASTVFDLHRLPGQPVITCIIDIPLGSLLTMTDRISANEDLDFVIHTALEEIARLAWEKRIPVVLDVAVEMSGLDKAIEDIEQWLLIGGHGSIKRAGEETTD